ncbi:MaoC/PaaZ C-terminal domain-containing protein [Streptomyces fagopyri]|uniref:MaoC/PaaZ C-terminal domain-containing protein n=1 Tax=Streptomyces fagopyri TaxID=2662397 RepID=UPI0033C8239F
MTARLSPGSATRTLTAPPALTPHLLRGALLSPFKRPRPDAPVPPDRLVLQDLRVDLAHLAAYERICGFATGSDALPVTYPHVLGFPLAMRLMASRPFPLPLLGLVHTSIEIGQRRAAAATGTYELAVYVEGLAPHRRGTEARVVTEARAGGELVWASRSTYLARHRTTGGALSAATEPAPPPPSTPTSTPTSAPAPVPAGNADRVTRPLPARAEWRLGGDVGRRYGAVSGDRNPIHLHPLTARLFGFPRPLAHGMWTVARCLAEQGSRGPVRVHADFKAPVLLPGTVTYAADGPVFELRSPDDPGRPHLTGEVHPADPGRF